MYLYNNKAKIGLVFFKLGICQGVYFDCIIIINLRGYIDLLDTSVIIFVINLLWFVFEFCVICVAELLVSSVICRLHGLSYLHVPACIWVFFYFVYSSQYSFLFWIMYLL